MGAGTGGGRQTGPVPGAGRMLILWCCGAGCSAAAATAVAAAAAVAAGTLAPPLAEVPSCVKLCSSCCSWLPDSRYVWGLDEGTPFMWFDECE